MHRKLLLAALALVLAGASASVLAAAAAPPTPTKAPEVRIVTTEGDIVVQLDPKRAPITVKNFLAYVHSGFYDGTIFHRVIPGFMIQGGGFTTTYEEKETRAPIKDEAANGLSNLRGTIAMARQSAADTATAEFFINLVDNRRLDYTGPTNPGYAVFGKVVSGMDVVDKIAKVPTGPVGPLMQNAPQTPIIIKKVVVVNP
ncbi:MAG: peptidylprolyl isomerase [Gammaproteobacteria bacterium]